MNYEKYKQNIKNQAKNYKISPLLNVAGMSSQQMASYAGIVDKVAVLDAWYTAKEKQITDECCKQFNEKLYEAEDYIALVNILISCIAIHMTWGYNKAIEKFIKNLNPAKEYIRKYGVKKVFEQVNQEFNADLEFDTFDVDEFIQKCAEVGE